MTRRRGDAEEDAEKTQARIFGIWKGTGLHSGRLHRGGLVSLREEYKVFGRAARCFCVSIYTAAKEQSLEDIRAALFHMVRNFEADAPTSRKQIRDLLDNDRALFYSSSIELQEPSRVAGRTIPGGSDGGQWHAARSPLRSRAE